VNHLLPCRRCKAPVLPWRSAKPPPRREVYEPGAVPIAAFGASLGAMGARISGRPAVALVALTVLLASVVVVSVTAGTKRRVILYGDSLAFEARDAFALSLQSGGDVEVVDRTFGGTAICDRLDRMRQDLHDLQPW